MLTPLVTFRPQLTSLPFQRGIHISKANWTQLRYFILQPAHQHQSGHWGGMERLAREASSFLRASTARYRPRKTSRGPWSLPRRPDRGWKVRVDNQPDGRDGSGEADDIVNADPNAASEDEDDLGLRIKEHEKKVASYFGGDADEVWPQQRYPVGLGIEEGDPEGCEAPVVYETTGGKVNFHRDDALDIATALQQEESNKLHSEYWTSEEPGMNDKGRKKFKVLQPYRAKFSTAKNPGDGRMDISELKVGQVFRGIITETWLHQGVRIDFGANYDGIVHMTEDEWVDPVLQKELDPGKEVTVRIFKILNEVYRWPVLCELLEPDLMDRIAPPEKWESPIDWRGKDSHEVIRAAGIENTIPKVFLPVDENVMMENLDKITGKKEVDMVSEEEEERIVDEMFDEMGYSAAHLLQDLDNFDMWGSSYL